MVLGMVDVATRFHQAAVLSGRTPEIAYEAFERVWLRPYGLPTLVAADPDGCFQGDFQNRLESHGTLVEHCPPEAHWNGRLPTWSARTPCCAPSSRSWWTPFPRPRLQRWTCSSLRRSMPLTAWYLAGADQRFPASWTTRHWRSPQRPTRQQRQKGCARRRSRRSQT